MARRIEVEIIGDSKSYQRALGQAQSKTSKFGAVAKTALIGGAAAGLYALGKAAKIGWDEYNEGARVAAQTNAVIESTGGVANVSAQHVEELGHALMLKSGIDDEAIKSGENLLLTFKNVRNEVGKGNDIFDQATKAALDMSVALGTDTTSAAMALGKALNDPSKGLARLTRMGVTFSDKQIEVITRLDETGRTAEAQRLILKELRSEFGKSAEAAGDTLAGQINILKERFSNFTGDLVGKAIPAISDFLDLATGKHTATFKISATLAGAGTALEKLLFGSPSERVRVPVDQRHFEWVVTGGGGGLVGAIGDAIRDINWTEVGNKIAVGLGEAGQKAGDSLADEFAKTAKDKISSPSDIFSAAWSAAKVELEFFPFTHVWRAVWNLIEEDAEAGTKAVGISLGGMAGDAVAATGKVDTLDAAVRGLHSKTIHINAVVNGLGYVAALQEHISLINSKSVTVNAQKVPEGATGGYVGKTGLAVIHKGEHLIPPRAAAVGAGGGRVMALLVGDQEIISALRALDERSGRRSGRGVL